MEAAIHVLDQNTVGNYLSHSSESTPTIITGTGCDDVNYKLNWMNQIVLTVLPAGRKGNRPLTTTRCGTGAISKPDWRLLNR